MSTIHKRGDLLPKHHACRGLREQGGAKEGRGEGWDARRTQNKAKEERKE